MREHFAILIVDDEKGIRFALKKALQKEGHTVHEAENLSTAREILAQETVDVLLLDMKLPDGSGLELLSECKQQHADKIVIMMTAFGDVDMAVSAMQMGAENFRTKPFNVDEMKQCIQKAVEYKRTRHELEMYRQAEKDKYAGHNIVGKSQVIHDVFELIGKVSKSPSTTVLIEGPSGTGKELVARAIHHSSARSAKRFIDINCTAIPENLLESELFGYERGAFTDAKKDHAGIFEQAEGGTLFLDEIGDMPLNMQAKLLRSLQEKHIKRIGGTRNIPIDVRVIASTNVNLEEAVKDGRFREDLYYRLKVVPIKMPPLKHRDYDVLLIARHYALQFAAEFKKRIAGFSKQAEEELCRYDWPGNVRELKNLVERAVLLGEGEWITAGHLGFSADDSGLPGDTIAPGEDMAAFKPQALTGEAPLKPAISADEKVTENGSSENGNGFTLRVRSLNIEDVEKALLEEALQLENWNRNAVSKIVGINRTTLYAKIKKYGLEHLSADVN